MLIDTRTEKQLPLPRNGEYSQGTGVTCQELDGCRRWMTTKGFTLFLFPTAHLDLPPDMLELWAQVAARGHLGR